MNTKKGISLVVLGITVIIIVILASAAVIVSNEIFINSRTAAFEMDLESIEDLAEEYYLNNNKLPVEEDVTYDKESLVALLGDGAEVLTEEITLNGDDDEIFRIIDMTKLSIESNMKGLRFSIRRGCY